MDAAVSVIVPAHNRPKHLQECLESVACQTYSHLEVIVVDDASDEDIEQVLASIDWPEGVTSRYLRSHENVGPGAARELGRKVATGKFICYLDSDDLWHEQKVELQVRALLNNPTAGMCYCTSAQFQKLPIAGQEPTRKRSHQSYTSFLPAVLYGRPWDTSACMWTREATERLGPWFAGWTWEDYEYDTRAGCNDIEIVFVPEILCFKRQDYGGAQLSEPERRERNKVQQTRSLLEIARQLQDSGKVSEAAIQERLARLLYNNMLHLMAHGEPTLADACLSELTRFNCPGGRVGVAVRLVKYFRVVVPDRFVARVGYRLRPFLSL